MIMFVQEHFIDNWKKKCNFLNSGKCSIKKLKYFVTRLSSEVEPFVFRRPSYLLYDYLINLYNYYSNMQFLYHNLVVTYCINYYHVLYTLRVSSST